MKSISRVLSTFCGQMPTRKTAALIVIGDEILKGTTKDTNSHFLCNRLHVLGVNLRKISVVGDDIEEIAQEIRLASEKYDYVITSGGVGPTHDDKTYLGMARAFSDDLHFSGEVRDAVNRFLPSYTARKLANMPKDTDGEAVQNVIQMATEKLCTIPKSAELLWGKQKMNGNTSTFPVVRISNVIALPGVPRFCERAFDELQDQLFPESDRQTLTLKTIYTSLDEFEFSKSLSDIALKYSEEEVEIGSYPELRNNFYKTKLTIESTCQEIVEKVIEDLEGILKGSIVYYDAFAWIDTVEKWDAFKRRQNNEFARKLEEAETIIERIIEEYQIDQIALSFNGGKDCTVLLHLLRLKVDEKYGAGIPIQGFHIMVEDQFPEATQFIINAAKFYNITVLEFPGPLKSGLSSLKQTRPSIVAVLMGSRATDPNGKYMKTPIEWTDSDWPRVLRVCPILSWTYNEVWQLLRGLCVPYCELYDQGYTSLGGRDNTIRNPSLRRVDSNGKEYYLPAYKLIDETEERSNRSNI